MLLARFASVTATTLEPWETSWDGLRDALTGPPVRAWSKGEVPLWGPFEGSSRRLADVRAVHVAVIDVDAAPARALGEAIERLRGLGVAAVVHTSYGAAGAAPGGTKFRAVVRLAEPVPPARWGDAWRRIVAAVAPAHADPACKDASHIYYLPSCPPPEACPDGWSPFAWSQEGPGLDPWTLPDPGGGGAPTRAATLEDLTTLARVWSRSGRSQTAHLGRALAAVAKGDPYAAEGERDTTTFDLVRRLVEAAPEVRPETWAPLFAPSLAVMGRGAPTVEAITAKAVAARRWLDTRASAEDGLPWIVVSSVGASYWVRDQGGWCGPYGQDAVDVALRRHLAYAESIGAVTLTDEKGKFRTRNELASRYALPVDVHTIELGRERTEVTVRDGRVRLAEAQATVQGDPQWSTLVAEYLDRLVPEPRQRADVDVWLATLPDLREPLVALVLTGPRGAGKSLFATAASTLWGSNGPTRAGSVLGDYNGGILRCPLVFADEALPTLRSGENATAVLRELIQARQHTIRRKYLPDVEAIGSIRLVVAANSARVLSFDANMTPEDVHALAERFYHLEVSRSAAKWLEEDPSRGPAIVDAFAGHVAFLARYLVREKRGRFWLVTERSEALAETLAIRGGVRSELCRWVCTWLTQPERARKTPRSCYVADGRIRIYLRHVHEAWDQYLPGAQRPTVQHLTDAVRVLAADGRPNLRGEWEIDPKRIGAWVREVGWDTDVTAAAAEYERRLGQ